MAIFSQKRKFLRLHTMCSHTTQFVDIHTHLFAPAFGKLGLWGIDDC